MSEKTVLFDTAQFKTFAPSASAQRCGAIYALQRRIEQIDDNSKRKGFDVAYAMGVDYVFIRKSAARFFANGMIPVEGVRGGRGAKWALSGPALQFALTLIGVGVTPQTLRNWVRKYTDFKDSFVIIGSGGR